MGGLDGFLFDVCNVTCAEIIGVRTDRVLALSARNSSIPTLRYNDNMIFFQVTWRALSGTASVAAAVSNQPQRSDDSMPSVVRRHRRTVSSQRTCYPRATAVALGVLLHENAYKTLAKVESEMYPLLKNDR